MGRWARRCASPCACPACTPRSSAPRSRSAGKKTRRCCRRAPCRRPSSSGSARAGARSPARRGAARSELSLRPESDRRPLADGFVAARSIRCETVFAALALIAVAVLSAVAIVDPPLAARLTVEHGAVEWLQVLLEAGAALLFGRDLVRNARATGRVSPLELVVVVSLVAVIMGEIDLDRLLFNTKIVSARFLLHGKAALHWRLLALSVLWGDRKSTRLNSSHLGISYAVFCLKKKNTHTKHGLIQTNNKRNHQTRTRHGPHTTTPTNNPRDNDSTAKQATANETARMTPDANPRR